MARDVHISGGALHDGDGRVGQLEIGGDLVVPAGSKIKDTDGYDLASFGRSFASTELYTTASRVATDGLPRITLPDAAVTSVFAGPIGMPPAWLDHGLTIGFDVTNDHTSGGNVRWRLIFRKFNSFGTKAGPTVALDSSVTVAAPAAGGLATVAQVAWQDIAVTSDVFGSLYCLELQRVGNDGADTVGGPIGLTEIAFVRA